MRNELAGVLDYGTARRDHRMAAAQWVLDHPESFAALLEFSFQHDEDIAIRACWVLEFVCKEDLRLLYPHLDLFFQEIPKAYDDSSVRPLANICEMLCLRHYKKKDRELEQVFLHRHKEILTECCFDWLITDQKVACKVRAMTCLELLGSEIDWIHPELIQILERDIHAGSAGYKNRAGKILMRLRV